jgi:hypothetical protein
MPVCLPPCRFWANNQSRMYLLEGTAELQHFYHLRMGDVLMFAQKRDGNIVLVGRPATKADALKRTPLKRGPPPPTTTSSRPLPAGRQGGGVVSSLGPVQHVAESTWHSMDVCVACPPEPPAVAKQEASCIFNCCIVHVVHGVQSATPDWTHAMPHST